jgi:hypothetical protein
MQKKKQEEEIIRKYNKYNFIKDNTESLSIIKKLEEIKDTIKQLYNLAIVSIEKYNKYIDYYDNKIVSNVNIKRNNIIRIINNFINSAKSECVKLNNEDKIKKKLIHYHNLIFDNLLE